MVIFSWIVLSLVGLLLGLSGVCWLLVVLDDSRWKKLGVRLFRFALVGVLFYINGAVWWHIVKSLV